MFLRTFAWCIGCLSYPYQGVYLAFFVPLTGCANSWRQCEVGCHDSKMTGHHRQRKDGISHQHLYQQQKTGAYLLLAEHLSKELFLYYFRPLYNRPSDTV